MSHSPVRLALLHPKRLLLLAAVAALLAGLAIALQPASAQTEDPPAPKITVGDRNADGTFPLSIENVKYSRYNSMRPHPGTVMAAGIEFGWAGQAPIRGWSAGRNHVLSYDLGSTITYAHATHGTRDVKSPLTFTATYPVNGDAGEDDRSYDLVIPMSGFEADGTTPLGSPYATTTLTLNPPPTPAASVMGALRQDADGKLAPRDSTQLTIGIRIAPDFDGYPNLAANTQACVALGSRDPDTTDETDIADTTPMGACGDNEDAAEAGGALLDSSSYLVITGPATFSNGSKRISVVDLKCEASSAVVSSLPAGNGTCYARWDHDGDGDATDLTVPTISVAADAADEITVTANLVARQDANAANGEEIFYAVLDNKDGTEGTGLSGAALELAQRRVWHSDTGTYYKLGRSYFGQYTIGIDTVQQLSSVALSRRVNPTTRLLESGPVRISTPAIFNLALRNANGQASSIGAVSAITVTAVGGGTITSQYCPSNNLSSCTVNLTTTVPEGRKSVRVDSTTGNMPGLLGAIPFTFNAPAKPGTSTIRATVIGTTAGNFQESLTIIVSGSATAITLGAGVPSILAYDTAVAATATTAAVAKDDRDTVSIPVSATDANGNPARIPDDARVQVTGPGGAALPSGSHSAEVRCANTERTRCGVVIDVEAAAATPLPSGLYKATVIGSGVDEIEASFNVAGNPASVSISVPEKGELGAVGESFTATVTVTDADGTPVADGEAIEFSSQATAGGVLTARVVSPSEVGGTRTGRTRNGQVAAQVTIVGRGVSVLTATAPADSAASRTAKSGTAVINTEASAIPVSGDAGPVIRYLTPDGQPGTGPADYLGAAQSTATAILAMNEAASAVWLFNGARWIRYAEDADGEAIPGSIPFSVLPGDILWFGG